jgi:hypothetical protein
MSRSELIGRFFTVFFVNPSSIICVLLESE